MRLASRYKQTIYVSNETFYGSGEYLEPYPLKVIVRPLNDRLIVGGGVEYLQNDCELKSESWQKGIELITKNSLIWIRKKPDPNKLNNDNTHTVISRDVSADSWFISIECRSNATSGGDPIV